MARGTTAERGCQESLDKQDETISSSSHVETERTMCCAHKERGTFRRLRALTAEEEGALSRKEQLCLEDGS